MAAVHSGHLSPWPNRREEEEEGKIIISRGLFQYRSPWLGSYSVLCLTVHPVWMQVTQNGCCCNRSWYPAAIILFGHCSFHWTATPFTAVPLCGLLTPFWARSWNCEKILRASCLSFGLFVCLAVRMQRLGSHWTNFLEIWYLNTFSKIFGVNSSFIKIW